MDDKSEDLNGELKRDLVDLKESFAPLINMESRILILGSLPGDESLRRNEYYGHPRNRFWKIMAKLFDSSLPANYKEKLELLHLHQIALWDVANVAIRQGSLDSAIQNVVPNNIDDLVERHQNLEVIGFNGKKAAGIYSKFLERRSTIRYVSLPSTSPANARINFEELFKNWKEALSV